MNWRPDLRCTRRSRRSWFSGLVSCAGIRRALLVGWVSLRLSCCDSLFSIQACCLRSGTRASGARLMSRCCAPLCFQGCRGYFIRARVRWVRLVVCPSWRSVMRAVACARLWVFRGWRWRVGSPCIPRWLRIFPRSFVGLWWFRL